MKNHQEIHPKTIQTPIENTEHWKASGVSKMMKHQIQDKKNITSIMTSYETTNTSKHLENL